MSAPVWSYKFRVLEAEFVVTRKPNRAIELLSMEPPPELSSGEFAARREVTLGLAYGLTRNFPAARNSLEHAEQEASGSQPEVLIKAAFDRAYLAILQRQYAPAEQYYRRAVDLAHEHSETHLEADARINLGKLLMDHERYDEAIKHFEIAGQLAQSSRARASEQMALGNLGWSHLQIGDAAQATSFLTQAADIAAQIHDLKDQERWLRDAGIRYYVQGDLSRAEGYYQRALLAAKEIGDKDIVATNLHNLAELELRRMNPKKADEYNHKAFAAAGLSSEDRSDPYLVLTTAEIAKMRQQFPQAEDLLQSVIRNNDADSSLRWQAQSDLANVYVAQNKFDDAEREFQNAVQIVEKASIEVKQEERRMSILDAWPFYDDYIRFLVDRGNPAKALQIAEFSRARALAEAFGINAQQRASGVQVPRVQSLLASRNQIILAYWLSDKQSYLWVITPAKFQIFPLPAKNDIEQAIQGNDRQMLKDRREVDESSDAQRLYEMLVKPAEKLIPKNARVIIVPNRSLYKLNFETLVVPGAKPHYWIEDVQVDYESSIALLASSNHRKPRISQGVLLTGATVEVKKEFPLLKHATEEMQKVESHFPGDLAKVVSGKDATPQAYRSGDPGDYRIIHFVSHGTASEMNPLDSAIILSPDPDGSYKLYARDIKDVPLRADLVTISACYGMGSRTYSGEGIVGLAWAFMRAGAHQVVGALWEVDEASSPQLMDDFYSELTQGKSAAEALRDAKLKMLHSNSFYRHPYYWASLQLYTGS